MNETDFIRTLGAEAFASCEECACMGYTDFAQDVGRNDGGRNAQFDLAEGETCVVSSQGNVTDSDESDAASHRCPMYTCNDWTRKCINSLHEVGELQRILYILIYTVCDRLLHHLDICSRAK